MKTNEFGWIWDLKVENAAPISQETIDRTALRARLKAISGIRTPEANAERAKIQAELRK